LQFETRTFNLQNNFFADFLGEPFCRRFRRDDPDVWQPHLERLADLAEVFTFRLTIRETSGFVSLISCAGKIFLRLK